MLVALIAVEQIAVGDRVEMLETVFGCVQKIASCCLSVSAEQLGSHWTDFHEI
jgi:hypothetical protein